MAADDIISVDLLGSDYDTTLLVFQVFGDTYLIVVDGAV